jgi:ABC-type antimicrobial peptide transport system permease subunit
VVGDVHYSSPDEPPRPDVYISYMQAPRSDLFLSIRTAGPPTAVLEAVRREVHGLNLDLPLFDVKSMEERNRDATSRARFRVVLLSVFASIALALSAIGIYGVMSYLVRQQTREIGIRIALGARGRCAEMILRRTAGLAGAGIAIGLAGALALTRLLTALLYPVKPGDPQTYASISVLLAATALVAGYLPACRASALDPSTALRSE